jgi:hypothetical protein
MREMGGSEMALKDMCEALRDDMESVGSHWYKDRVIREIGRSGTRCLVPFLCMTWYGQGIR